MAIVGLTNGVNDNTFAFIVAAYPEGSTCTCSNGSKTLRAKGTSGSFVFYITSSGTWTLSCTDGTDTDTKTVIINEEGQSVSVSLSYRTYLIENGTVNTALSAMNTRTWGTANTLENFGVSVNTDSIVVRSGTGANWKSGVYITDSRIDVSECASLELELSGASDTSSIAFHICLTTACGTTTGYNNRAATKVFYANSYVNGGTIKLDISGLSGTYYVGIGLFEGNGTARAAQTITIKNFYLK